jgi:hypothetical protein
MVQARRSAGTRARQGDSLGQGPAREPGHRLGDPQGQCGFEDRHVVDPTCCRRRPRIRPKLRRGAAQKSACPLAERYHSRANNAAENQSRASSSADGRIRPHSRANTMAARIFGPGPARRSPAFSAAPVAAPQTTQVAEILKAMSPLLAKAVHLTQRNSAARVRNEVACLAGSGDRENPR